MGRAPCCDKANVKRGPWSPEEDAKLKEYIDKHGTGGNWIALPQKAGLRRCGKSCRLRWLNYLRPNIRHGEFSDDEDRIISTLFANIGSRWSIIAAQLPGRTDNDIKNYWNTKLKKKLLMGSSSLIMVPPLPHKIRPQYSSITTYQPSISFLQSPSSSSSPPPYSSPSPHNTYNNNNNNNNNYSSTIATTARSPFTGNYYDYDPSSMSNITPSSSNNQLLMHLHTQDGFVSPMQNYLYSQGKHSSPLIMFGDQAAAANSCSSSDGSNCNNKDQVEHEQAQFTMFSTGNNIIDGNDDDVPEKQINGWLLNGIGDQTPLDYYSSSLEEIKQLISSSTTSNMISSCNSNLNFFVDDQNKTSAHLQEAEKKSSFTSYPTDVD